MKNCMFILLLITAFVARLQAQTTHEEHNYGVMAMPTPCSGLANMQDGSVDWSGELINRSVTPLSAPNQQYIDSIKLAKLLLKEATQIAGNYARTTSVHPVMGTNFAANTYVPGYASNNSIAISDSGYIVSVNNSRIMFFKSNGTQLYNGYITSFMPFGGVGIANPVVLYDTKADRFIFVCQQYPIVDTGKIYICFSRSYNPAASVGWYCYALRGNPGAASDHDGFDFPRIAVNDSELFITGNLYASPGSTSAYFDKPIIHQIDKLSGYAGASMSSIYYPYVSGNPFGLLPISEGQSAGITTGMYLLNTTHTGGGTIGLYKITGNLFSSPSITYTTISTSSYTVPANAHQMGTSNLLDVGDCRALSGFLLNNTIHFVFNADAGSGYCGINYNRLNITTSSNTSTMLGLSGYDYAYPSVASYATTATDPSVMIGFGATGSTIYPEVRVVNCDSALSWSATTLVHGGISYGGTTTGTQPWGNYSGMSRWNHHAAPSVWMNGGFGNTTHNWDTWVAEIHDATTTPCPIPTGLFANGITNNSAALHWTAVGGAISYNIQYRPSATTTWSTTTSTTTTKTITGLSASTNYEFQVQTVCTDSGTGSFSLSDTFTTHGPPAGIAGIAGNTGTRIFPNPVSHHFSVEFTLPEHSMLNIVITDMTGRLVKQLYAGAAEAGLNQFSFDQSYLTNGCYLLSITADDKPVKTEKMVIAE